MRPKIWAYNFFLEKDLNRPCLINVYHDTILYRNKILKKDNTILSSIKTQTNRHKTFLIFNTYQTLLINCALKGYGLKNKSLLLIRVKISFFFNYTFIVV